MAAKEISVKKYVVKLTGDERRHLHELIRTGKRSAQLLMKARILLKADTSSAGEGWSDSQIVKALETSLATVCPDAATIGGGGLRSGADAQASPTSARPRIFDGEQRGQTNRLGLFDTAAGTCTMDAEAARRQGRGAEHR